MAWKDLAALPNRTCAHVLGERVQFRPHDGAPLFVQAIFSEAHQPVQEQSPEGGVVSDLQAACDVQLSLLPRMPELEDELLVESSGYVYTVYDVEKGPGVGAACVVRLRLHRLAAAGSAAVSLQASAGGTGELA